MNENYYQTIKLLNDKLEDSNIDWFLTGKTNLALQGINVNSSHLGIVFNHKYLNTFLELFNNYSHTKVIELENKECLEYKMFINAVTVMVCAEYDHGIYSIANKSPLIINYKDLKIPCINLKDELVCYNHLELFETAKLIENHLKTLES